MRIINWRGGVRSVSLVGLIVVTACAALIARATTSQAATGQGRAVTAPGQTHPGVTPKVRRRGILVLLGNGTAYDLDSRAAGWDPLVGASWTAQNIMYVPHWKGTVPALFIAGEPADDVLMGAKGPWSYQSCASAPYDRNLAGNPNTAAGSALDIGHGICVITTNTLQPDGKPLKTDGGHFVLLVVKARGGGTLTLEITVWQ
jgi:hypothetical protein